MSLVFETLVISLLVIIRLKTRLLQVKDVVPRDKRELNISHSHATYMQARGGFLNLQWGLFNSLRGGETGIHIPHPVRGG